MRHTRLRVEMRGKEPVRNEVNKTENWKARMCYYEGKTAFDIPGE